MITSAINGSQDNIYAGMAVSLKSDRATRASTTLIASAIARDGAQPLGVVTLAKDGIVYLTDWTMATGSKTLVVGATYYTADNGMISTTEGSQSIGQAISVRELSVQIGLFLVKETNNYQVINQPSDFVVLHGMGSPIPNLGKDGGLFKDSGMGQISFWGPKIGYDWGSPVYSAGWGNTLNAKDDFGAVGDGIADDTEALQRALLQGWPTWPNWMDGTTPDAYRTLLIPPGTYLITHPLIVPFYRHVLGCGRGAVGTTIKADAAFDLDYNDAFTATPAYPGITRAPCGMLQSNTVTSDPTGQQRWVFRPFDTNFQYYNGTLIENIVLDGSACTTISPNSGPLSGIRIEGPGENLCLRNIWIQYFKGSGIWFSGGMTGPSVENSAMWVCEDSAIKITSSPYMHSIAPGSYTAGEIFLKRLSGDYNRPAYFYLTQPVNMHVEQCKYEHPWNTDTNVIRIDVDPIWVGTGTGMNQGGRCCVTVVGGNYQNSIDLVSPYGPGTAEYFCHIMKTGSTDYREWPKPVLVFIGMMRYHRNVVIDDTYQTWAHYGDPAADGITIGLDSADPLTQYNPFGLFVYSNDTNERTGIHCHDTRLTGTTLYFPDGTHIP